MQHVLGKVLELVRIRVVESLHEVRHRVVAHPVGLGHDGDRRLSQVADADGALEAENLRRDVVAVNAAAGEIDDAELAAREGQAGDRVVDVADRGELGVRDRRADGRHGAHLAHEPARQVEIVNAHVDQHAAAACGIGILETGTERIARCRLEDQRLADAAGVDLLLCRRISRVEAAHEAHLQERARRGDGIAHLRHFRERQRGRLLAECRFLARRGGNDVFAMHVCWRDDDDHIHSLVVNQRQWIGIRLRDVELVRDVLREVAEGVGDGDELRLGNPSGQVARVDAAETAETDESNIQALHRDGRVWILLRSCESSPPA